MDQIDERAGLCASCLHARLVTLGRGSAFVLCGRSQADERYAKYPRLPVMRCAGYEAGETREAQRAP